MDLVNGDGEQHILTIDNKHILKGNPLNSFDTTYKYMFNTPVPNISSNCILTLNALSRMSSPTAENTQDWSAKLGLPDNSCDSLHDNLVTA